MFFLYEPFIYIESHSQLEALKNLKCESGQGYLLSKPMTAHELFIFLTAADSPIPAPSIDLTISRMIQ